MDWCYPMMLFGKNEGEVETITANQVIDKEHTLFDNYVKCVLDGVKFYSQKHFYKKKVWIGHWVSHIMLTLVCRY